MAAGDFTASQIQIAQARAVSMFPSVDNLVNPQLNEPAATARALMARQRSRSEGIFRNGQCVGVEAYRFKTSAASVSAPGTCATPSGTEGESAKTTYSNSVLARASAVVEDNRCDNLITFAEELAQQQLAIMAVLRERLNNNVVIPALNSASQENLDANLPDTWDDTTNTPRIVVPLEDFSYTNLNEFRILAANNDFSSDFFFVSGRLFNNDRWMADLNSANETLRNQALAYAQRMIYFDERDLDVTMTRKTAFAVDAGAYHFWNTFRNTPEMRMVDTANNRWEFTVTDPLLSWNDGGQLRPVVYEFEMEKACLERGALEFRRYSYKLYGRLIGGFQFLPTGPDGQKGVLQFATE